MRFGRQASIRNVGYRCLSLIIQGPKKFFGSQIIDDQSLGPLASENTATRRLFGSIAATFQRGFSADPRATDCNAYRRTPESLVPNLTRMRADCEAPLHFFECPRSPLLASSSGRYVG